MLPVRCPPLLAGLATGSLQAEALRVVYGDRQPVAQLAARGVRRHREQVEARVRVGQLHRVVACPKRRSGEIER